MRKISLVAIFIILFFLSVYAKSSAKVVFEHFRGTAYNFPSPVKIEQSGESDLKEGFINPRC